MKKFAKIISLIVLVVYGCSSDEDISPIVQNPGFNTLLLKTELPTDVGYTDLTNNLNQDLQDAIILGDKMLLNIGGSVYSYENNVYTEKIDYAGQITRTSDGIIHVLGNDAIYMSMDNGESFTKQDKFVSGLSTQFALDVYYNGSPNNILVRKTTSGQYVMWLYTAYKYYLGGTGFSIMRYQNFVFTSPDGQHWDYQSEAGAPSDSYPSAIDDDGTVYLTKMISDGQTYTTYEFYKSSDLGANRELVESNALVPNTISNSNKLFLIDRITIDDRFESNFKQWENGSWIDLNPTIDEKAIGANVSQLIVERVNFSKNGEMILINSNGIYKSDTSF